MTGAAAAVVSPEAPLKVLSDKIIHHGRNDDNDDDSDLEYSLTTDEGSLKGSITSIPDETINKGAAIEGNNDKDTDKDNVKDDDNDKISDKTDEAEKRRFLPMRTNKKPLSILKRKNNSNNNNNNGNVSNANRIMPIKNKGKSIKNKEKAMCEYFNEEDNLDEGDLPSLQVIINTQTKSPVKFSSNGNSHDHSGNHRRVVSPSPTHASTSASMRDSGATTPVQDNTEMKNHRNKIMKKLKKNGHGAINSSSSTSKRNGANTNTNQNNNSNSASETAEKNVVTLTVPKLNPEDRRKHRAFWDQFDAKHSDESENENGSQTDKSDIAPRDERSGLRSTPMSGAGSNSKFTPRKKEVLQNEEEEDDDDKGIISMVVDLCSDCGWMTGDGDVGNTKVNNTNHHKMKRRRSSKEMNSILTDVDTDVDVGDGDGNGDGDDDDDDDDDTLTRRQRGRKEDDSTIMTRESSFRSRGDASHRTETDDESTKYSGSRTPSVRRKRGNFPRQNSDYSSSSYLSMNQIESNRVKEPQNFEHTKIEVEYEEDDAKFLQLNKDGDVDLYQHPGERKKGDEQSIYHEPMPSDEQKYQANLSSERGGNLMSKSNSWSEPQKSAYLQAMAQKAKQDFNKRKGVVEQQQQQHQQQSQSRNRVPISSVRSKTRQKDDEDSLNGILGENKARTEQAPKSSKAIDWAKHNWTPSEKRRLFHLVKSEGMTPEEATEVLIAARPANRRNGHTEQRSYDGESPKVEEVVVRERSTTPKTKVSSPSQPVRESNGQYPMDEAPPSPPTSRVQGVADNDISPLKSVGSPGSIAARSKSTGSVILSNLRKRPGFNRVVDANLQDQSDEQSHEESVEISLEHSLNNSVQSPGSKNVSKSSKKKKGSKSGRMWHQIGDDDDDEYAEDENAVAAAQNVRGTKDSKRNDDIFDFESTEGTEGKSSAPLDAVKLDPYHDSCDVSHLGSMMTNDHTIMSSNRSVYTTATNSSSWSTSTRRRHRGAAKNRHENNDKKPVGWLDSIRAAAESNNREWDPQVGWIGYVESNEDNNEINDKQDVARIGKLKPPKIAKSIKDLRHQAESAARRVDESVEEEEISVPFPSEWEKERDEMVSVYRDDDGAASAITEVIKNSMGDNDSVDVASNADTEVVSNHVKSRKRIVYNSIPERIVEDSYYSDDDSSQSANEVVQEQVQAIEEECEDFLAEEKERGVEKNNESNADNIMSLQSEARENLKDMVFSAHTEEVSYQKNIPSPVIKKDEYKVDMQSVSSPKSNRSVSYNSIGPHSPGSISLNSGSNDPVNEKDNDSNNNEIGSDTAESSSDEEDGGEFDNGMSSFEFSEVDKIESTEDSGFKVIKNTPPSPVFKLSDIKILDDDEEEAHNDDKSVASTSSMMSRRAKEWRQKVETKKRSISTQRQEILAEEPIQDHGNIFISAADDNSTIEYRERPKILNVDEEDTLFDFGGANEPAKSQSINKKVEAPKNLVHRKQSLSRRRPKIEDDQTTDDMSEITTPTVDMTKPDGTFLERLHSCTVDAVGRCDDQRQRGSGLPKAHLQFLRNNSTADVGGTSKSKDNRAGGLINLLTSPGLCGKSESIEDSDDEKPRMMSKRASLASNYLEAIKAGKCGSEIRKTPSVHSSGSGHSETWQRFLDKRAVALSSGRSNTDVSKAAQEYASKKVDEIVKRVNNEDKDRRKQAMFPLTRPPSSNRSKLYTARKLARHTRDEIMSKSDAAKAAEDLAAARVEAMMAMEPRTLSHDESEI